MVSQRSDRWDVSSLLLWAIGCFTAAFAARLGAGVQHARDASRRESSAGGGISPADDEGEATIGADTAVAFLVVASAFLLGLYFLLQASVTAA